jgi:hypothetical protein
VAGFVVLVPKGFGVADEVAGLNKLSEGRDVLFRLPKRDVIVMDGANEQKMHRGRTQRVLVAELDGRTRRPRIFRGRVQMLILREAARHPLESCTQSNVSSEGRMFRRCFVRCKAGQL